MLHIHFAISKFQKLSLSNEAKCKVFLVTMSIISAAYPDVSLDENVSAKEDGKDPSHGPLRFITSHSRFALASTTRKTKRLRRRLVLFA